MSGRSTSSVRAALLTGVGTIMSLISGCGGGNGGSSGSPAPTGPPGALDPSFGNHGVVITPTGGDTYTDAVLVQANGMIVVAGYDQATGTFGSINRVTTQIARFAADGAPHTGFGQGGQTTVSELDVPGRYAPIALALQTDGTMLLDVPGGSTRLLPNGAVDTTYGIGGTAAGVGGYLALQPNGKLVTAQTALIGDSRTTFALSRYASDGAVDTSFGGGGDSVIALRTDSVAGGVAIQPDGRIVVAGYESPDQVSDSGAGSVVVARYFGDRASSAQP